MGKKEAIGKRKGSASGISRPSYIIAKGKQIGQEGERERERENAVSQVT